MTFITKKKMARRTMLKGLGASLALPMLDSMIPALSAATAPTTRLGWVYVSHGVIWSQWKPTTLGQGFELTPNLKPLEKLNGQFNILTGLSHLEADTKGDGSGDHTRASAAWLTGVHAYDRTRPGVEVKLATTADQLAAQVLGEHSRIPSIEMTVDSASAGSCDSGDCFYVNTVSWRSPSTPNLPENQPRVIFERLFGDGGSSAQRVARAKKAGSILDSVMEEASGLASIATAPSLASISIPFATSSSAFKAPSRRPPTISSCRIAPSASPTASKSTPSSCSIFRSWRTAPI
jgi:hypothetical protein